MALENVNDRGRARAMEDWKEEQRQWKRDDRKGLLRNGKGLDPRLSSGFKQMSQRGYNNWEK